MLSWPQSHDRRRAVHLVAKKKPDYNQNVHGMKECTLFDSRNLERDVLTAEQKGRTVIADLE